MKIKQLVHIKSEALRCLKLYENDEDPDSFLVEYRKRHEGEIEIVNRFLDREVPKEIIDAINDLYKRE